MADFIKNSVTTNVDDAYISLGSYLVGDGLLFGDVINRYNEGANYMAFLEANMFWTVSPNNVMRWHEEGWLSNNIQIASFTGGASPNASAVITISAANHTDSGRKSPFFVGLVIDVEGTQMLIQSKNTSTPNAHTITVVPQNGSGVQLNTILAPNKTAIPIAPFYAEQTGYNNGQTSLPEVFEEYTGIVKNKNTISSSAALQKLKINIAEGKDAYIYKVDRDTFIQHKLYMNYALLLGKGGLYTDADGKLVRAVKGLVQQVKERGYTQNIVGAYTLSDAYNTTRLLTKQAAPKMNYIQEGHEFTIAREQFMTDVMKQGARRYLDATVKEGGKKMIDFGFNGFTIAGDFTFMYQPMSDFNHPIVSAAGGQTYPFDAVIAPMSVVKDAKTGEKVFSMTIGYRSGSGPQGIKFDRKFQGRLGGEAVERNGMSDSEIDEVNFRYLTECGLVLRGANQSIYITRTDI